MIDAFKGGMYIEIVFYLIGCIIEQNLGFAIAHSMSTHSSTTSTT